MQRILKKYLVSLASFTVHSSLSYLTVMCFFIKTRDDLYEWIVIKLKLRKVSFFFLFPQAMNCYLSSFIPFVHQAYFYFQGYLQVSFIWISCWLESKSSSFLINYTCIQNIIHVLFPISKRRSLHLNVSKECNKDASRLVLFSLLRVLFIIFGALGQCASEWQKVIKRFI